MTVRGGGRSRSSFSFPDSLHVEKEGGKNFTLETPDATRLVPPFILVASVSRNFFFGGWTRRGVSTGGRRAQLIPSLLLFTFAGLGGDVTVSTRRGAWWHIDSEVVLVVLESTCSLFNNRK